MNMGYLCCIHQSRLAVNATSVDIRSKCFRMSWSTSPAARVHRRGQPRCRILSHAPDVVRILGESCDLIPMIFGESEGKVCEMWSCEGVNYDAGERGE